MFRAMFIHCTFSHLGVSNTCRLHTIVAEILAVPATTVRTFAVQRDPRKAFTHPVHRNREPCINNTYTNSYTSISLLKSQEGSIDEQSIRHPLHRTHEITSHVPLLLAPLQRETSKHAVSLSYSMGTI